MRKTIRQWCDMLVIWAIHRFRVKLPDLQRETIPQVGKIYYYYGRWVRIVPHTDDTRQWVKNFKETHDMHLLDIPDQSLAAIGRLNDKIAIQNELAAHLCPTCIFSRLGLPCKKVYRQTSRLTDLCFTHQYQLIKGRNHDEQIFTQ